MCPTTGIPHNLRVPRPSDLVDLLDLGNLPYLNIATLHTHYTCTVTSLVASSGAVAGDGWRLLLLRIWCIYSNFCYFLSP